MKKLSLNKKLILVVTASFVATVFLAVLLGGAKNNLQASVLAATVSQNAVINRITRQLANPPQETADPQVLCAEPSGARPDYKAEFLAKETKVWAAPGSYFEAVVYVKNVGNSVWFSDSSGCSGKNSVRLGTSRERDRESVFHNPADGRWISKNRIAMAEKRVEPGQIATFSFSARSADASDIFREYFQPVVEGVKWIDGKDTIGYVDIYVGDTNAQDESKLFYLGTSGRVSALDLSGDPIVHVDISEQKLKLMFGNTVVREYLVSTGTFKTPTPLGTFKILNKQELRIGSARPHYRMPSWQGFTRGGAGFHALPYLANDKGVFWKEALNHIGQRASHGCIRLLPEDAQEFYGLTQLGMTVHVHA